MLGYAVPPPCVSCRGGAVCVWRYCVGVAASRCASFSGTFGSQREYADSGLDATFAEYRAACVHVPVHVPLPVPALVCAWRVCVCVRVGGGGGGGGGCGVVVVVCVVWCVCARACGRMARTISVRCPSA